MVDTLPSKIRKHESLICNLAKFDEMGTHWICIYNSPHLDNIIFYDSFGIMPNKRIEKFLRTSNKKILMNSSMMQNFKSILCGYYCIYVLESLSKGKSFYDVCYNLDQIPSNQNYDFIKRIF